MIKSKLFTPFEIDYLAGWNNNKRMQDHYNHIDSTDSFISDIEPKLNQVWSFMEPSVNDWI